MLVSGGGLSELQGNVSRHPDAGSGDPACKGCLRGPVLLVEGEQDEVFPVAEARRLAERWGSNGVAVSLRVVPGVAQDLSPERGVVFRGIGEFCLTHLVGPEAWRDYHSIAQWQAEGLPLWVFWLPAMGWVGLWVWRRKGEKQKAETGEDKADSKKRERDLTANAESAESIAGGEIGAERAEGRLPNGRATGKGKDRAAGQTSSTAGGRAEGTTDSASIAALAGGEIGAERQLRPTGRELFGRRRRMFGFPVSVLPWLAGILAALAVADSAVHLVPPYLVIYDGGAPGQGTGPTMRGGTPGEGTGPTIGGGTPGEGTGPTVRGEAPGQGTGPTVRGGTPGRGAGPTGSFFHVRVNVLGLARRFLVQPKERADFEFLVAQPIWSGVTLRVLLDHVELAGYNRELINWTLSDDLYRGYVLEPGIIQKQKAEMGGGQEESRERKTESGKLKVEDLDWRRVLWEEFYPRIRHESCRRTRRGLWCGICMSG